MVNEDNRRFESTANPVNRLKLEGLPVSVDALDLDPLMLIRLRENRALINGLPCSRDKILSLIERFKEL